jgi:hypothetical protein
MDFPRLLRALRTKYDLDDAALFVRTWQNRSGAGRSTDEPALGKQG